MNGKFLFALAALFGLGTIFGKKSASAASPSPTPSPTPTDAPIRVIGDSHAQGISQALKVNPLAKGRLTSVVKVGQAASAMLPLSDQDSLTILSAGTNDLAGSSGVDQAVTATLRVLGPYARGEAQKGRVLFLLPESENLGALYQDLTPKLKLFSQELQRRVTDSSRLVFLPMSGTRSDGIHYLPSSYVKMAQEALEILEGL